MAERHHMIACFDDGEWTDTAPADEVAAELAARVAKLAAEHPLYPGLTASPGIDRVLRKPRDFTRERGKKVDVTLYAPREGKKLVVGELTGFDGDAIELDGETKIPLADIAQVRLHIDF